MRELPPPNVPEGAIVTFLENIRWPQEIRCPHCDSAEHPYVVNSRKGGDEKEYRCKSCDLPFSVKTHTVLSGAKVPLSTWIAAARELRNKPNASTVYIAEKIKRSQKTAWNIVRLLKIDAEKHEHLYIDDKWEWNYLDFRLAISDAITDHKDVLKNRYLERLDGSAGTEYDFIKLDVAEFVINELLKDDYLLHEVVYPMMMKRNRKMANR